MKLRDYLERTSQTTAQFAAALGVSSETVRRYAAGTRIPDAKVMPKIVAETAGAVMPNDFYEVRA